MPKNQLKCSKIGENLSGVRFWLTPFPTTRNRENTVVYNYTYAYNVDFMTMYDFIITITKNLST